MADALIADGKVVQFHYTLTDPDGQVIDSSDGGEPLAYLHGAQNIVPGLERQLTGRTVGDKLDAVVPPGEGYGERDPEGLRMAPRDAFPEDLDIQPGMNFLLQGEDGSHAPVWVVDLRPEGIVLDTNHPLAGVELHFAVEISSIRDASAEEQAHGHPHMPGHHHHHD